MENSKEQILEKIILDRNEFQDEKNMNDTIMRYVRNTLDEIGRANYERSRSYLDNVGRESEGRTGYSESEGIFQETTYLDFKWYSSYSYEAVSRTIEFPIKTIEHFSKNAMSKNKTRAVLNAKNNILWCTEDIGEKYREIERINQDITLVLEMEEKDGKYNLSMSRA